MSPRLPVEPVYSVTDLTREIKGAKYSLVKITGLTPGETYYFATQVTDQNGNRYFSNEVSVTLPSGV